MKRRSGQLARALVAIAFATLGATAGASPQRSGDDAVRRGAELYAERCASCHGTRLQGSADAPALYHVGAASVQWWVGSGRMPAAVPGTMQAVRDRPQFDDPSIAALVAFITHESPGGIPIPAYRLSSAPVDLAHGRRIYAENCQQCHGAVAQGNTVGFNYVAPRLWHVPPQQIADAIRIGPGPMPHFGPRQLDDRGLSDVTSYVVSLQGPGGDPGGFALADYGPVAEGLAAWVFGLGALLGVIRAIGTDD